MLPAAVSRLQASPRYRAGCFAIQKQRREIALISPLA